MTSQHHRQRYKPYNNLKHRPLSFYIKRYGLELGQYVHNFKLAGRGMLPWAVAYGNIYARCLSRTDVKFKYYGGVGIKCEISSAQLKRLFIRDKAYLMKRPSIDRKDSLKNYTVKNCAWIEFEDNLAKRLWHEKKRIREVREIKNMIDKKVKKFGWPSRILLGFIRSFAKEYKFNLNGSCNTKNIHEKKVIIA